MPVRPYVTLQEHSWSLGIPRREYPRGLFACAATIRRTPNPLPILSMGVFSDRRLLG
jgi:hypothetical protein